MVRNKELETALKRHEIIAPLLVPGLDDAEKTADKAGDTGQGEHIRKDAAKIYCSIPREKL